MRTEIGPIRLLKSSPRHCQGPQISKNVHCFHIVAHIWRAGHFPCCTYVSIMMRSSFADTLVPWIQQMVFQDLPNINTNHTLDFLHVDWYWWKERWEARWIHEYWRAPRSHKYKYIHFSQCDPYIWNISCLFVIIMHVSTLWWNVLALTKNYIIKFILKYSWGLEA